MAKGVIYVMSTVVDGLIKIGKTETKNFNSRMYTLERNGYANVTGLKRRFAIEVEDYDEKEKLLDEIFSKSRVPNTELFAADGDLVIQLLSSFEGTQIYPEMETKEEVFEKATEELKEKAGIGSIPDGTYTLVRSIRGFGKTKGILEVKDGILTVKAGSKCAPMDERYAKEQIKDAKIVDHILMEDVICNSPSTAGTLVTGKSVNGWAEWKNNEGDPIDIYRGENS